VVSVFVEVGYGALHMPGISKSKLGFGIRRNALARTNNASIAWQLCVYAQHTS